MESEENYIKRWYDVSVPQETYFGAFIASFPAINGTPKVKFRIPLGCCSGSIFQVCITDEMAHNILELNRFGSIPRSDIPNTSFQEAYLSCAQWRVQDSTYL
jgi:hypothetical protein